MVLEHVNDTISGDVCPNMIEYLPIKSLVYCTGTGVLIVSEIKSAHFAAASLTADSLLATIVWLIPKLGSRAGLFVIKCDTPASSYFTGASMTFLDALGLVDEGNDDDGIDDDGIDDDGFDDDGLDDDGLDDDGLDDDGLDDDGLDDDGLDDDGLDDDGLDDDGLDDDGIDDDGLDDDGLDDDGEDDGFELLGTLELGTPDDGTDVGEGVLTII